ncbi:hypothetical protein [Mycobacterium asiaticum]|uniref:hypothetical protein n=1 Tax=Mycobacterium asiaticum TaxID=1790 RepID=UPI0015610BDD|nr:hypothetical protein [Mycobacterium asiaticum]
MAATGAERKTEELVYTLQRLLWDVRKNPTLAERFRADPDGVLDEYRVEGEGRAAMASLDLKTLYDGGVNPYLLYFCALQIGVDRAEYYGRIRGEIT